MIIVLNLFSGSGKYFSQHQEIIQSAISENNCSKRPWYAFQRSRRNYYHRLAKTEILRTGARVGDEHPQSPVLAVMPSSVNGDVMVAQSEISSAILFTHIHEGTILF